QESLLGRACRQGRQWRPWTRPHLDSAGPRVVEGRSGRRGAVLGGAGGARLGARALGSLARGSLAARALAAAAATTALGWRSRGAALGGGGAPGARAASRR